MKNLYVSQFFCILLILLGFSSARALKRDKSFRFAKLKSDKDWHKKSSNFALNWQMASDFRNTERDSDSSFIFRTKLRPVLQLRLSDDFRFFGDFSASFQTGRSQSRYGDLSPNSGVFVNEAMALWSPFKGDIFTIELGALNQDRVAKSRLIVRGSAFPGLSQKFKFKVGDVSVKLRAQQTVPYSQTQEVELQNEKEDLPLFFTETLQLDYRTKNFNLMFMGGLYEYKDLPSVVADRSRILGNSISGLGSNASYFKYGFKGWYAKAGWDFYLGKSVLIQLTAEVAENKEAVETFNRAHDYGARLLFKERRHHYGLGWSVFSSEPDAAPAFYNSSTTGNTNREGFSVQLSFFRNMHSENKYLLYVDYVRADLLNPSLNVVQQNQEVFFLGFKTHFKEVGF